MSNIITQRPFQDKEIVVLGAGIIGCATARTLLQKGFKVTLIAKHLPGDTDIWYASNWAGALWHGARGIDDSQKYLQAVTYRRFTDDLRKDDKCGVCSIRVKEYFQDIPNSENDLWFAGVNSNFKDLEKSQFDQNEFQYGCEYDSISIEPHVYLLYVKKEIEKLGGKFIKKEILNVAEIYEMFPDNALMVNASGVGPKYIEGLYDPNSYPNRGQNVLVKTRTDTAFTRSGGEYTYVIPRPLSGVVVCGGINQPNLTHPEIDPEIVADEIKRAHRLAPEVVSEDPEIAGYVVGIRPGRKNDYRLEKEKISEDRYIVHVYGFNGKGYACSYGAAHYASIMVEEVEKELSIKPKVASKKKSLFSFLS